jgi:hypothetical protein
MFLDVRCLYGIRGGPRTSKSDLCMIKTIKILDFLLILQSLSIFKFIRDIPFWEGIHLEGASQDVLSFRSVTVDTIWAHTSSFIMNTRIVIHNMSFMIGK